MKTETKTPLLRETIAKHLEKMYAKYQVYDKMPENENGYYFIEWESHIKIADSLIPMIKNACKDTTLKQHSEEQQEKYDKLKKAFEEVLNAYLITNEEYIDYTGSQEEQRQDWRTRAGLTINDKEGSQLTIEKLLECLCVDPSDNNIKMKYWEAYNLGLSTHVK